MPVEYQIVVETRRLSFCNESIDRNKLIFSFAEEIFRTRKKSRKDSFSDITDFEHRYLWWTLHNDLREILYCKFITFLVILHTCSYVCTYYEKIQ
ncbi:hypothetical protein PUN28_000884 [Cardiocondyla obscurior]|uniref:Uncharacterized protein n=1 Tax=Cardiocondyla obscurior TaxID=286306 RepID=A0AAW2H1N0_9HYME